MEKGPGGRSFFLGNGKDDIDLDFGEGEGGVTRSDALSLEGGAVVEEDQEG